MPCATPVTAPFELPTVAIETSLLLHVPPVVVLDKVVVAPEHIADAPVIETGVAYTVTGNVAFTQPLLNVYVTVVLPVATGDRIPEDAPMVATEVLLLLHAPPGAPLVNVLVLPRQAAELPVIDAGVWLTVTVTLAGVPQPLE